MAANRSSARESQKAGSQGRVGFFGKVPTHGDFVFAGLDNAFQQAFDQWLQQALRASQRQLESEWLRAYRQAPTWRFVLERGVCGPLAAAGVLMPNVDRVGRYFPLVLAAQISGADDNPKSLASDQAWFAAAEALVETSLYGDFNLATFAANVSRLRLPSADTPQAGPRAPHRPNGAATTTWWTKGARGSGPSGFICAGMPDAMDFRRLLISRPTPRPGAESVGQGLASSQARLRTQISLRNSHSTHAGTRAVFNSDCVYASDRPHIYAVADGVGSSRDGATAAKFSIHALSTISDQLSLNDLILEAKGKLGRAHGILKSANVFADGTVPSASIVALVSVGDQYAVLSAGDARCYLLRGGTMVSLTRDHLEIGLVRRLANGIGGALSFIPDTIIEPLVHGDRFLLCSAPLPRVLDERSIAETLLAQQVEAAADALIQDCLISDIKENVSAVVIGAAAE